jgi:hypothetical protein
VDGPSPSWAGLTTGERFIIKSVSGSQYEATFLMAGMAQAGIYVRLLDNKLARLRPERLDMKTLERLLPDEILQPNDPVLFIARDDKGELVETRGQYVQHSSEYLTVTLVGGESRKTQLRRMLSGSFRLMFTARDLCVGDEFLLLTRRGLEHRGVATAVEPEKISFIRDDTRARVTIPRAELRFDRLTVLIAVPFAALDASSPG